MKLDSNIYGADETSTASECAAQALRPPQPNREGGAPIGASSSQGASKPSAIDEKGDVVIKDQGYSNDSRAVSKGGHAVTYERRGK